MMEWFAVKKWRAVWRSQKIKVLLALLGVVIAYGSISHSFISKEGKKFRVLIAKRDLEVGEKTHFSDFSFQLEKDLPEGAFTDRDILWLEKATILKPVRSGEKLYFTNLEFNSEKNVLKIPAGMRAIALRVAPFIGIKPGDKIDLWSIQGSWDGAVSILLSGVLVLLTPSPHSLVLAVEAKDIQTLERNQASGQLKAVLRNANEPGEYQRTFSTKHPKIQIYAD